MMDSDALLTSKTFRDPHQVEKDYLQDRLLYQLYSKSESEFVFKGGAAISKFYHSDRFSEDLDFTINRPGTDSKRIIGLLDDVMDGMEYKTSYLQRPEANRFGTLKAVMAIEGPRYNRRQSTMQQVRFEINTSAVLTAKPSAMQRAPPYRDAENYIALVMDGAEIMAEKVRALMSQRRRHRERDLYDMYFLLTKSTQINKKMAIGKLREAGMELSAAGLRASIGSVSESWGGLAPWCSTGSRTTGMSVALCPTG